MNEKFSIGRYETEILRLFDVRFRSSAQRSGGRKVRIAGFEHEFPAIRNSVGERTLFLEAIERLVSIGVISVKWEKFKKGDEIIAAYLENPGMMYELLGMTHPDDESRQIACAVRIDEAKTPASKRLVRYISGLMLEKKELPFESESDYRDAVKIVDIPDADRNGLPLRALSVRFFSDSKRIERLLNVLSSIADRLDMPEITANLERSYPECSIKGNIVIEFTDGRAWRLCGDIVTLGPGIIEKIKTVVPAEGFFPSICSVENKETFYHIGGIRDFAGYIYCGGHLNAAVRSLILKTHRSSIQLSHFGDLDPDGILIFNEINGLCGGTCRPFMMSEAVFLNYIDFGYELSSQQIARLPENAPGFEAVIELIRSKKKGVEQEIVDFH